jgi:recombination protein RecT
MARSRGLGDVYKRQLPDGREGALVWFNTKVKVRKEGTNAWEEKTIKQVQWMPMIGGIRKKARNSGELSGINAHVVFHADKFRFWVDEEGSHLIYEPADNPPVITAENAAKEVRLVFAWARTKDGEFFIERMSVADIEKVRSISRAKNGSAWVQWWDQMAIKTAVRRLSKVLPMSSDLDDLVRRDDELYDFDNGGGKQQPTMLDLSATTRETTSAPPLPPPSDASDGQASGDDKSAASGSDAADNSGHTAAGGSAPASSPDASADQQREASKLEGEIAQALVDARSLGACDDVGKLFAKEIADANDTVRAACFSLIADRKAAISRDAADFPGDR